MVEKPRTSISEERRRCNRSPYRPRRLDLTQYPQPLNLTTKPTWFAELGQSRYRFQARCILFTVPTGAINTRSAAKSCHRSLPERYVFRIENQHDDANSALVASWPVSSSPGLGGCAAGDRLRSDGDAGRGRRSPGQDDGRHGRRRFASAFFSRNRGILTPGGTGISRAGPAGKTSRQGRPASVRGRSHRPIAPG